jgi:hypothetical protein
MIWDLAKLFRLFLSLRSSSSIRKSRDHILLLHRKLHLGIGKTSSGSGCPAVGLLSSLPPKMRGKKYLIRLFPQESLMLSSLVSKGSGSV